MKRNTIVVAALVFCSASSAFAVWSVSNKGMWPETWPQELEPLRKQSRTLQGSLANLTFHEIPFTNRDDFEAAWPHILKIKSKGVPITLFRSPHKFLGTLKAGVRIWHPPYQTRNIWLVVDGDIVDLNRIPFPPDALIIDKRFEDKKTNGVVARAESSELRYTSGKLQPRVERDEDGNVTRLKLTDLKLSPADITELSGLKHLRSLALFGTNITDQDLVHLSECPNLEHLNLTNTEVTDDAIESILKIKKLKSVCLGNVKVTQAGIEKLKEENRSRKQSREAYLRWGYSQRK